MAVATGIGWAIGYWLDRRFSTGPWLMLIFLLIGVAAGFKGLLRTARQMQRDAAAAESNRSRTESNPRHHP